MQDNHQPNAGEKPNPAPFLKIIVNERVASTFGQSNARTDQCKNEYCTQ